MCFPARSNHFHVLEIASSGKERPPRNDPLVLEKAMRSSTSPRLDLVVESRQDLLYTGGRLYYEKSLYFP